MSGRGMPRPVDAEAKLIARADEEVIGPLSDLADAMISVDAFCALLSDLRARDLPNAEKSHGVAIHMVRAGLLRAAIGTAVYSRDRKGHSCDSIYLPGRKTIPVKGLA
jgi:hypothetical protein